MDVEGDGEHRFDLAAGRDVGENLHPHPALRLVAVGELAFVVDRAPGKCLAKRRFGARPRIVAVDFPQAAPDEFVARLLRPSEVGRVAEHEPVLRVPSTDGKVDHIDQPFDVGEPVSFRKRAV